MTEERLPDEKLDEEIEKQSQNPPGGADTPQSKSEEDQQVEQSKDDAIRSERKKRKEAEQREKDKQEKIETLRREREEHDNPPKLKRDYKKGESIRDEHLQGKAERLLINFRLDNPDATELAVTVKKILFNEKPFLLEQGKEGFDMAVDIAKGRLPQPEKESALSKPQTSAPQPGGKGQSESLDPPPLTEKEEKEMSKDELKKREDESIAKRKLKFGL